MGSTHEVLNQPPPLVDYDLAGADPILAKALVREGAGWAGPHVDVFGRRMASSEVISWGFEANANPPRLRTHDRYGNRVDQVEFHPSWHSLLDLAVTNGLHSIPWETGPGEGGFAARTALTFLAGQIESGHWCPISMAFAAVPALRHQPELAGQWEPLQLSREYDPSFLPPAEKKGVMLGMGMTEKQGGSDVRSNTTLALPVSGGGPGGEYLITGHKWFMSSPMSDAFLVLARAPGGLSCFLLPRFTPDGEVNEIRLQRLKDKLGNHSNASSEAEFEGAWARMVGEEGRGVATIIEMVAGTRLDCIAGSASLMRQAVTQAIHHTRHRRAFGSLLIEKALMRNVLADIEIETEAAVLLMMRVAGAFDRADTDGHEDLVKRILTPVAKYWVTKRCSEVVREALECLGGGGYVEESMMPRLYRESPLNAIWEGSGNVIALDVIRVLAREPRAVEALRSEIEESRGHDRRLDRAITAAFADFNMGDAEYRARSLVEGLALAAAGSLLARYAAPEVFEAFAASRLGGHRGSLFGTLPAGVDTEAIIEPAVPV
ncbi:MAG: acyl-CoA dehydrogenase family protein [Acidimicrobiia bacterium]